MLSSVKHPTLGKSPRGLPRQLTDLEWQWETSQSELWTLGWSSGLGGFRWVDSGWNYLINPSHHSVLGVRCIRKESQVGWQELVGIPNTEEGTGWSLCCWASCMWPAADTVNDRNCSLPQALKVVDQSRKRYKWKKGQAEKEWALSVLFSKWKCSRLRQMFSVWNTGKVFESCVSLFASLLIWIGFAGLKYSIWGQAGDKGEVT